MSVEINGIGTILGLTPSGIPSAESVGYDSSTVKTRLDTIAGSSGADGIGFLQSGVGAAARTVQAKLRDVVSVKDFGAVGDGVADDTAAIKATVAYAQSLTASGSATDVKKGKITVDLCGGLYGITDTILVTRDIKIKNGSLVALSAPTYSSFMLVISGASAEGATIDNVDFDGGLAGTTRYANLIDVSAPRTSVYNVTGVHFPEYGIRVNGSAQENFFRDILLREWQFDEAGTADESLRTATALHVADGDSTYTNVICAQSLLPAYISGSANIFTGCHFYNGGGNPSTTVNDTAVTLDNCNSNIFSGCYFDNGAVKINTQFSHVFNGCLFLNGGTSSVEYAIIINSIATGEEVRDLVVTGCYFRDIVNYVDIIAFVGGGAYVDDLLKKIQFVGNTRYNGRFPKFKAKLLDSILCGQNTIKFAPNGVQEWEIDAYGNLLPKDNENIIGGATNRLYSMYTNRMFIADGVAAPASSINGHAILYIDNADGDLKIRFADGVVKTIVTDS